MTNKKFKVAAMSMALTACVAAQPLIANAADDVNAVSNEPAPQSEEGSSTVADTSTGNNTESNGSESKGTEGENANGSNEGGENANANNGEATTGKDETGKETETPAGVNKQGENPEDLLGDKDVNYDHENPPKNEPGRFHHRHGYRDRLQQEGRHHNGRHH